MVFRDPPPRPLNRWFVIAPLTSCRWILRRDSLYRSCHPREPLCYPWFCRPFLFGFNDSAIFIRSASFLVSFNFPYDRVRHNFFKCSARTRFPSENSLNRQIDVLVTYLFSSLTCCFVWAACFTRQLIRHANCSVRRFTRWFRLLGPEGERILLRADIVENRNTLTLTTCTERGKPLPKVVRSNRVMCIGFNCRCLEAMLAICITCIIATIFHFIWEEKTHVTFDERWLTCTGWTCTWWIVKQLPYAGHSRNAARYSINRLSGNLHSSNILNHTIGNGTHR